MVDKINVDRHDHIWTIEPDRVPPYHKNCVVNQREVAAERHSFGAALGPHFARIRTSFWWRMRDLETLKWLCVSLKRAT